jgi:hypothetical protein
MINLLVDGGYAFDYLSILQIKAEKGGSKELFNLCKNNIISQIGIALYLEIEASQEYKDLLNANLNTFNLVDVVKTNPCVGGAVDKSNYERFLKKKALAKKFFFEECSEVKIGY